MSQQDLDPSLDWHLVRRDLWEKSSDITRSSEIRRAYDCSQDQRLCTHSPKAQHGFRFDEWWYGLRRDRYILTLGVCPCTATGVEVPERFRWLMGGPPTALSTIVSVALLDAEGNRIVPGRDERGFPVRKFTEHVVRRVDNAFCEKYVIRDYEQPERFWSALEAMFIADIEDHQRKSSN